VGKLLGIDAVILAFAGVDEMDVECVDQNEGQARGSASIGQPIPTEHAFTTNR
jgi:hypothetical protein